MMTWPSGHVPHQPGSCSIVPNKASKADPEMIARFPPGVQITIPVHGNDKKLRLSQEVNSQLGVRIGSGEGNQESGTVQ